MSKHYEKVKQYYEDGRWSIARVREAVVKKWITEDEFWLITNKNY